MKLWIAVLAVLVAVAGTSPNGQTPTGAAPRSPARPTTPLIMMSPKATPPGWTGVHRPHTKLTDVLARHKGQADWTETIVDDESGVDRTGRGAAQQTVFALHVRLVDVPDFARVQRVVVEGGFVDEAVEAFIREWPC